MSQDEPKVSNDLSSDESLSPQNQEIIDTELEELQDRIKFKRWLFYFIIGMSIVFTVFLLTYIAAPYIALLYMPSDSLEIVTELIESQSERLMVIGTIAALIILLPLALIRVIYLPAKIKEDSGDSVSIWQGMAKELLDIFRKYVDNRNN